MSKNNPEYIIAQEIYNAGANHIVHVLTGVLVEGLADVHPCAEDDCNHELCFLLSALDWLHQARPYLEAAKWERENERLASALSEIDLGG